MSDTYLRLIPTEPTYVPDADARRAATARLRTLAPLADAVTAEVTDEVSFVDPGSNLESVSCPACGHDVKHWWNDAMNRAWETRFADLVATVPCCGSAISLNDLRYDWPAGFARFTLEARNPNVRDLAPDEVAGLESTLNCKLRQIWARY